jgi:tetratricopeptide (TPR) repeat protein
MLPVFQSGSIPRALRLGLASVCLHWLLITTAPAETLTVTNLLAQGEQAERRGDVADALRAYSAAESLISTDCPALCRLTRLYCDLMHDAPTATQQKDLAGHALATALRAEKADPKSATAHLCVAVCFAKNFPYTSTETKVKWSREIKVECETAIALDPKQDVGYYLLGRWNYGVANMNFLVKGLVKVIYGGLPKASNEEAIRDFRQAISLAPNRIINHFELARVYEVTGEYRLEREELVTCRALKALDRDDADAQRDAIEKLTAMGDQNH